MDAIRIAGLHKHFGPVRALDGLDLTVAPGAIFGFLGPNGAGKTTTLRILAGLAQATAGRSWLMGAEVGRSETRQLFGYLPDVPAYYGWMNAREYLVDFVAPLFGLPPAAARQRADELLSMAGLADVAKRRIGGYSRGMRQRLGIAQALMHRPPILLLDEPVSALDPLGRHEVLEFIAGLQGQITIFMSTHILNDVERVCDMVGIINKGRLVVQAGREELLARYAQAIVAVEFDAGVDAVAAWVDTLAGHPLLDGAGAAGRVAHLAVRDAAAAKRELPGLVAQAGLPVQRYEWSRPSLEDVFLRLVEN